MARKPGKKKDVKKDLKPSAIAEEILAHRPKCLVCRLPITSVNGRSGLQCDPCRAEGARLQGGTAVTWTGGPVLRLVAEPAKRGEALR